MSLKNTEFLARSIFIASAACVKGELRYPFSIQRKPQFGEKTQREIRMGNSKNSLKIIATLYGFFNGSAKPLV